MTREFLLWPSVFIYWFILKSSNSSEKVQSLFMVTISIKPQQILSVRNSCQDSYDIYIQRASNVNGTFHYRTYIKRASNLNGTFHYRTKTNFKPDIRPLSTNMLNKQQGSHKHKPNKLLKSHYRHS
ncbi:hypothetical protein TorRG33x02_167110 [Trema orientale]|uniref:Uncharacterized protein n=1 Tax=Trema orientale TaxID=63057 RepID=A0A2P5EPQ5_TREOI|nr:hypothetical protein TorRG33x02_167110 [Trema orientale]